MTLRVSKYGLIHQHPLPEVKEYYDEDQFYTQHVKAEEWFGKERREYEAGLWNPYFEYLASRMNPDLPLIDVGCGAGWFINYWNRRPIKYFAYGIEPSGMAREYYDDTFMFVSLQKFVEFYQEKIYNIDSFNILMSLVLEHVPDPVDFIKQYLLYMGEHGTLTIVVPNDFSPLQQWLGSTHFISDVHVNYFTRRSLWETIYEALPKSYPPVQYTIEESATFPMELFELLGFHYIENGDLGRKCHNFRLHLEKFFGPRIFKFYEKLYDKYGWGRELIFTIRKG